MAPAVRAHRPGGAVAALPKHHTAKRATSLPHGIDGQSTPDLPKPLTHEARRTLANKTNKLIKMRNKLDRALRREAERGQIRLDPSGRLSRKDVLTLRGALAKREAKHLRARSKAIIKRERLYKCDPSLERKIDLALLQALQGKLKHSIIASLPDRERPLRRGKSDSNTSSDTSDGSGEEGVHAEGGPKSVADSGPSSTKVNSEQDHSREDSSAGATRQSTSSMDGAFDDCCREESKKGDLIAKEPRKQAKKERTTDKPQTNVPGSQAHQPSLTSTYFQDEEAEYAGDLAAIDSMPPSKKKLKTYGNKARFKTLHIKETHANGTAALSASSNDLLPAKTSSFESGPANCPFPTQSPRIEKLAAQNDPLFEPWYKRHARAIMDPDFDDLVYDRPSRKRKRSRGDEHVHGAMPDPRNVVSGELPLPTPPDSSQVSSQSCSA